MTERIKKANREEVGVVLIDGTAAGKEVLLRADTACAVAKRRPQSAYVIYDESDPEFVS